MSFVPPCRRPEADPDDWFIDTDGKQYRDDDLLSTDDLDQILNEMPEDSDTEEIDAAIEAAQESRRKEQLVKRRHAIEACFNDCIGRVRLACLSTALDDRIPHGIWGGYTPKQRRKVLDANDKRRMGSSLTD